MKKFKEYLPQVLTYLILIGIFLLLIQVITKCSSKDSFYQELGKEFREIKNEFNKGYKPDSVELNK